MSPDAAVGRRASKSPGRPARCASRSATGKSARIPLGLPRAPRFRRTSSENAKPEEGDQQAEHRGKEQEQQPVLPPKRTELRVHPPKQFIPELVDPSVDAIDPGLDGFESGIDPVESGIDPVESSIDRVESGIDGYESGLDGLESDIDPVETGIDGFESDIDPVETGIDAGPLGVDLRGQDVDPATQARLKLSEAALNRPNVALKQSEANLDLRDLFRRRKPRLAAIDLLDHRGRRVRVKSGALQSG